MTDSCVLLTGGRISSSRQCWKLTLPTMKWTALPDLNVARHAHETLCVGNQVMCWGDMMMGRHCSMWSIWMIRVDRGILPVICLAGCIFIQQLATNNSFMRLVDVTLEQALCWTQYVSSGARKQTCLVALAEDPLWCSDTGSMYWEVSRTAVCHIILTRTSGRLTQNGTYSTIRCRVERPDPAVWWCEHLSDRGV